MRRSAEHSAGIFVRLVAKKGHSDASRNRLTVVSMVLPENAWKKSSALDARPGGIHRYLAEKSLLELCRYSVSQGVLSIGRSSPLPLRFVDILGHKIPTRLRQAYRRRNRLIC